MSRLLPHRGTNTRAAGATRQTGPVLRQMTVKVILVPTQLAALPTLLPKFRIHGLLGAHLAETQKIVAPKLQGLVLKAETGRLHLVDHLLAARPHMPHDPRVTDTGQTAKVDDRQRATRHQCLMDRRQHRAGILEVVIGVRQEHQIDAIRRQRRALLVIDHRHHVVDVILRRTRLDGLDEARRDIHRIDPPRRPHRASKQHRIQARAGADIRDPHARLDAQRLHHLKAPVEYLATTALEDLGPVVRIGIVVVGVHVGADRGGFRLHREAQANK